MDEQRKGILDNLLAPFGQNLVDPNGKVTQMLQDPQAAIDARAAQEEAARQAAIAAAQEKANQTSVMETAPQIQELKPLSKWNPFVLLFGQPGDPNDTGLLGNKPQ